MPTKIVFTKDALKSIAVPEAGRTYIYDAKTPGLAICVTATGKRTFYWTGRLAGDFQRIRLGPFPKVTIEVARKAAANVNNEQAMGRDATATRTPVRERRLQELWDHYLEHRAKPKNKAWKKEEGTWTRVLSRWKRRKISSITPAEVLELTTEIAPRGPGAVNKVIDLIRAMYRHAKHPLNWVTTCPADDIERCSIESRERFLQTSELVAFFKALANLSTDTPRHFFFVALMTGARRANVAAMRWDEVNLDHGIWTIPAGKQKSRRAVTIALVPEVVTLLKSRVNSTPWVFPGKGRDGHFTEPKYAWSKLCEDAKLENLRIHDLRRTLASWQALAGTSLAIIGKSLGHSSLASTEVYARLHMDPVRKSVEQATTAIIKAGSQNNSENVENAAEAQ